MVCGAFGSPPRDGRCRKRGQRARNAAVPGCHSRPGNACPAAGRKRTKFLQPRPQPEAANIPISEPVAISDAPSLVPQTEPSPSDAAVSETDEIENFAARRRRLQARRKQARRSSRWTALILVLFAFNVALIGARSEVVRFLPQTASLFAAVGLPVNLRNLKFENMRISKEAQEGRRASSSKAPS